MYVKVKLKHVWSGHRIGSILPLVPRGKANVLISRGIAELVEDEATEEPPVSVAAEPPPVEPAPTPEVEEPAAVEDEATEELPDKWEPPAAKEPTAKPVKTTKRTKKGQ